MSRVTDITQDRTISDVPNLTEFGNGKPLFARIYLIEKYVLF